MAQHTATNIGLDLAQAIKHGILTASLSIMSPAIQGKAWSGVNHQPSSWLFPASSHTSSETDTQTSHCPMWEIQHASLGAFYGVPFSEL